MKHFFLFLILITIFGCLQKARDNKLIYNHLALKERAKFDFYYLNFKFQRFIIDKNDLKISFLTINLRPEEVMGDSLSFVLQIENLDSNKELLNYRGINGLSYYNNYNIKDIWIEEAKLENPEKILFQGYDKIFLDTLLKNKDILCPWLYQFVN